MSYRSYIPELLAALSVTILMTVVSWYLGGMPGTNGIDDAAITRSYSENIANGYGFVYNDGGERVEGATSFLWTLFLVVPYLFNDNPEVAILALTALLTVVSVFFALRISRRAGAGLPPMQITVLMSLALLGLPAFFIWSVWSMMEIALWSAICMVLLDRLSWLAEKANEIPRVDLLLVIAAMAAPLTRPEGIAVSIGLCVLTIILKPANWRPVGIALVATLVTFCTLTVVRLAYFGFPFPNTYYAKVSQDRLQNVLDGAKYLLSFLIEQTFAEVLVISWIILGAISVAQVIREPAPGRRTLVLGTAAVLGILGTYVMLGGDHFALWRFYQPIMPLMPLPLVIVALWVAQRTPAYGQAAVLLVGMSVWLAINNLAYHQERFKIAREFELSDRGEAFGEYLNAFSPRPTMGVTAAGGIALSYQGELRDLMGLNWVEMAHANPIKIGFRNHASFDVETFWKHPPQLLPQFHKPGCQREGWTERSSPSDTGVKRLFGQPEFQAIYTPVLFEMADGKCVNAFAANKWLEQVSDTRIKVIGWDQLNVVDSSAG